MCARTQVDVLVSVVGQDLDMKKTAVGKAVFKHSGSQAKAVGIFLESFMQSSIWITGPTVLQLILIIILQDHH